MPFGMGQKYDVNVTIVSAHNLDPELEYKVKVGGETLNLDNTEDCHYALTDAGKGANITWNKTFCFDGKKSLTASEVVEIVLMSGDDEAGLFYSIPLNTLLKNLRIQEKLRLSLMTWQRPTTARLLTKRCPSRSQRRALPTSSRFGRRPRTRLSRSRS